MATYPNSRIRALIEDTNDAFMSLGGGMNTDYAEFAGMALSEFKTALSEPGLTRSQLIGMLRSGMAKTRNDDPKRWTALMARQLERAVNAAANISTH